MKSEPMIAEAVRGNFTGGFLKIERLRYPGSVLRVRVSPFCLPFFADVKDKRVRVFSVCYLWAI
jgi:hypothetical protein